MIWCMWITPNGKIDIWLAQGDADEIDKNAKLWADVIFFEAELVVEPIAKEV